MLSGQEFRQEQRRVMMGMVGAVLVSGVTVAAAIWAGPPELYASLSLADRLAIAIKTDLFVVAWLAVAIGNLARLRFFSSQDISGSANPDQSRSAREASAILQNTLEQVTLAVPAHLAIAAVMEENLIVLPVLAGLFGAGRLLFWIGYNRGAAARSFGFALTFYPSLGAMVFAAYLALAS